MLSDPAIENTTTPGPQLDGQALYERQKATRAASPGPAIIAAGLKAPENMGGVLRLADAAGSRQVWFVGSHDSPASCARLRRTARSCDSFIRWAFCSLDSFLAQSDAFQPLIAIELTTDSRRLFETALPDPCAIVIGSERHGIPGPLLARCRAAVHIPMYGVNGSMNVNRPCMLYAH
jgi:23S rRNA (guanosine2251-2'-O)-methyltransferase